MSKSPATVTRFELVDETGRVYVRDPRSTGPVKVTLSYQDEGRTLKVRVESRDPAFRRARENVRKALADPKVKTALERQRNSNRAHSQIKNPITGTWTKRDDKSGKFMDVKADPKPFKGVRRERRT
jgi:hypothetical protein